MWVAGLSISLITLWWAHSYARDDHFGISGNCKELLQLSGAKTCLSWRSHQEIEVKIIAIFNDPKYQIRGFVKTGLTALLLALSVSYCVLLPEL